MRRLMIGSAVLIGMIMDLLHNQPDAPAGGVPATGVNDTSAVRPDAVDWPEGDLPEQGGSRQTIMPGNDAFRLPSNLAQCWGESQIEDNRQYLSNGAQNPTYKKKVIRKKLSLTKNSPLVIVGGKDDGLPMTAIFTSNPRPRGKKDDPKTPWIHDLAFLLEVSLADVSRPKSPEELVAAINKYAGHVVRIEHGLSAQCNPERVRYIVVSVVNPAFNPAMPETAVGGGNSKTVEQTMQDPSGKKGCGARYYTKDFRDPDSGGYDEQIECDCGALLRGFESVERFLPPVGSTQIAGGGANAPAAGQAGQAAAPAGQQRV